LVESDSRKSKEAPDFRDAGVSPAIFLLLTLWKTAGKMPALQGDAIHSHSRM
jgi:hypothetical protein